MSRSDLRDQAKVRAIELLGESDHGMTIRQVAICLSNEGLYSGQAFHTDRAAISYARSILKSLVKVRRVKVLERPVRLGGDLYRLNV